MDESLLGRSRVIWFACPASFFGQPRQVYPPEAESSINPSTPPLFPKTLIPKPHPGLAGLNQLSTNDQRLATILVLTFL